MTGVGIPQKLLFESMGHEITVECKDGGSYRGTLLNVEDNMNCFLEQVTVTQRDGKTFHLRQCYIRGANLRFVVVPDMLQFAPMFKYAQKGKTAQRLTTVPVRRA